LGEALPASVSFWKRHCKGQGQIWWGDPDLAVYGTIPNGFMGTPAMHALRVTLAKEPQKCPRCQSLFRLQLLEHKQGQVQRARSVDQGKDQHKDQDQVQGPYQDTGLSNDETSEDNDQVPQRGASVKEYPMIRPSKNGRHYGALRAVTYRDRHRQAEAIILPPQSFIPLKFENDFDNYNTGPTIEAKLGVSLSIRNFPTNPYGQRDELSCWTEFCDYGYRLDRNFALTFNCDNPLDPLAHFLPVADPTGYEERLDEEMAGGYSIARGQNDTRGPVAIGPVTTMGARDMIKKAGSLNSNASFDLFIRGRDKNGQDVRLDLRKDAQVQPEVHISLDIDSIIWVTHKLHLKQVAKIHIGPHMGNRPPIGKHNHVYVDVLLPQTDEERASNEYTYPQRFKVSSIPNTHFAQLGDGAGSCSISVAFPRMIHRQAETPYYATTMPWPVQATWFNCIVQPALRVLAKENLGMREYVDYTPDDWKHKITDNGSSSTKTVPVSHQLLLRFQEAMQEVIEDDCDLTMYGSFFFVVDVRGIKLWTKDSVGSTYQDPMEALQAELPALDLEYMAARANGRCVLDLGVSFTPNADEPLTGIWKLSECQNSYAMAGTNSPQIHYTNTLGNYGALQAEYPRDRSAAVQLTFRSTYNLFFEVVRRPGKDVLFCEDRDAYAGNNAFHKCISGYVSMYNNASQRSYGVREEIRGSIAAIRAILPHAKQKASSQGLLMHIVFYLTIRIIILRQGSTWPQGL
jgi:hypothetical protein